MWQYKATAISDECVDGKVQLFGVNIFDYKWTDTGENIDVGKYVDFDVYEVNIDGKIKRFAAGEVSNCVGVLCLQVLIRIIGQIKIIKEFGKEITYV